MALPVARIIGHKEWASGRKSDPSYQMNWRRTRVISFKPGGAEEEIPVAIGDEILRHLHGYGRRIENIEAKVERELSFVADQLGGTGWRDGNWGWDDWRGEGSDVKLTLLDYLREVDARLLRIEKALEARG